MSISESSSYAGSPHWQSRHCAETTVRMKSETESPVMVKSESQSPEMASQSYRMESEMNPQEDDVEDEDRASSVVIKPEDDDIKPASGSEDKMSFPEPTLKGCEWLEGAVDGDTVEGWGFLPEGALVYPQPMRYYDPFHPDNNGYYGSLSANDQMQYERMGNMPRWPDLMWPSCLAPNGPTLPRIDDLLAAPQPTSNELPPLRLPSDPSVFQRIRDARDEMHAQQQREALVLVVESSPVDSSSSVASAVASSSSSSAYSDAAEPDWMMAARDSVAASFEKQQRSSSKRRLEIELEREVGAQPGFRPDNSRLDCLRIKTSDDGVVRGLGIGFQLAQMLLKRPRRS